MTDNKFSIKDLDASSETAKKQLAELASSVFHKPEGELTKEEILALIRMEMSSIPTKIAINVDEVRRTQLQFCTWKGGLAAEIDLGELKLVAESLVTGEDNPIEGFIKASSYVKAFLISKMERTEALLRRQMNKTIQADGLEVIPGSRFS